MAGTKGISRLAAAALAALLLGGCLGAGEPSPAAGVAPEKQRDTCQHTSEGGQARTVCY